MIAEESQPTDQVFSTSYVIPLPKKPEYSMNLYNIKGHVMQYIRI